MVNGRETVKSSVPQEYQSDLIDSTTMADVLKQISSISYEQAKRVADQSSCDPIRLQNFVSGDFEAGADAWIDSTNPQTGKVFAKVPATSEADVKRAIAAAAKAFPSWSRTAKSERSRLLNRIADLIAERRETFAAWESIDQGKTVERARVEIERAESNFR